MLTFLMEKENDGKMTSNLALTGALEYLIY